VPTSIFRGPDVDQPTSRVVACAVSHHPAPTASGAVSVHGGAASTITPAPSAISRLLCRAVDSPWNDVSGTHHRTDIMVKLFGSPWKVLVLLLAVVVVVLVALFGSKKMPVSD
jgi:hypothetical protein